MKFRKKPVVIEAIRWNGKNYSEVNKFFGCDKFISHGDSVVIRTLEGRMLAEVGDWIIKEPFPTGDRTFYPCKPDIFEKTYEKVD